MICARRRSSVQGSVSKVARLIGWFWRNVGGGRRNASYSGGVPIARVRYAGLQYAATDEEGWGESTMKSRRILLIYLAVMAGMVVLAVAFPERLTAFLNRPSLYRHVLFIHILAVTLFFANAVIGVLWEWRSLASGRAEAILHTYDTVTWLDARFSSPLIVLSLISGITLTVILGDIWQIGWLSLAFILFLLSGAVWIASDIPTQYRIKRLIAEVDPAAKTLPTELLRLLKMRLWISIAGVLPLLAVFALMVYKPLIVPVAGWFG